MRVLVTGATGYIGGRLVPELLARGHVVRCGARTPAKLDARPWREDVEVARLDVLDRDSLEAACDGVDTVYHLVHSMGGDGDFARHDRDAAANVRDASAAAGVGRIVYLGGLGRADDELSPHLRSRHEVGEVLAAGPVPVTELRAAIIIGSGSASFEMLRNLTEVLPVMTTPRWVDTRCQPVAIRDILHYLCAVLDVEETAGEVLEVGGPDVLTYRELMHAYAEVAGLRRRLIIPVPVLTPRLSSLWVGLVTPLPTGLARPLVGSLVNEVVVHDTRLRELVPWEPMPFREAVALALTRVQDLDVATTWAGAGGAGSGAGGASMAHASATSTPSAPAGRSAPSTSASGPGSGATVAIEDGPPEDPQPEDPSWSGGRVFTDERFVACNASPEAVYRVACGLGGARGYGSARLLWEVRGLIDTLIGGEGLRRGRRHPDDLAVGDVVDFWRVEAMEAPTLLRLRAEMRVPGQAWLEFRIRPSGDGTWVEQRARFHPRGLWGRAYWGVMLPFHRFVFAPMLQRLARQAESLERSASAAP